ncbi:MAG: A/G-specific adenine glycosylase [Pseudomonadota bacterium]
MKNDTSKNHQTFSKHNLLSPQKEQFQKLILDHYRKNARDLPWRKTDDPYHILVSELMLQQTQVDRVIPKYTEFIRQFSGVKALAQAPLHRILKAWSGLGYNRRAVSLKKSAAYLAENFHGKIPGTCEELMQLPGIGPYTASAICVFAYNQPLTFIETNIRTVYIHFFFPGQQSVKDTDILPLVEKTLYTKNPRKWFNALMDYGVLLKKLHANPGRKSAHHTTQSPFKGSDREIRGLIIKTLLELSACTEKTLMEHVNKEQEKVKRILQQLQEEGFIQKRGGRIALA